MRDREPRLPVRATPGESEALGGFLLRMTLPLHMQVAEILAELNIAPSARALERLTRSVTTDEAREIAEAFGIPERRVDAMTVRGFGDGALNEVLAAHRVLDVSPVCVRCVAVGRWDLRWFTGMLAVCQVHRTTLVARCTDCATLLAPSAFRPADRVAGFVHGTGSTCCGGSGTAARPPVEVVHASDVAARLLDKTRGGRASDAADVVDALGMIAVLRRSRLDRGARPGASGTIEATDIGDVAAAVALVTQGPEAAAQHRQVVDFVKRAVRRRKALRLAGVARGRGPDRLATAVTRARERQLASNGVLEVPAPGFLGHVDLMPPVIPADLIQVDMSDLFDGFDLDEIRRFVAIAIVQPCGSASWAAPTRALGLPNSTGFVAREAVREIHAAGRDPEFWSMASLIRRELEAAQTNFAARRKVLIEDAASGGDLVYEFASAVRARPADASRWLLDRWACVSPRSVPQHLRLRGAVGAGVLNSIDGAVALDSVWRLDLDEMLGGGGDAAVRRYA